MIFLLFILFEYFSLFFPQPQEKADLKNLFYHIKGTPVIFLFFANRTSEKNRKMSDSQVGNLEKLNKVVDLLKTGFHWGYLPVVLYLGFRRGAEPGMPDLSIASLFWA
jgi:import receptor subunit TOM7